MSSPIYWNQAKDFLVQRDKVMARLIETYPESLVRIGDSFHTLARAIIGQQISIKAADSVWARLQCQVGKVTPQRIMEHSEASLRKAGLSWSKAGYLRNVAGFFLERDISDAYWQNRDFAEVREELLKIKGVGVWTVEMFAIFHLHEPDIFSARDIGLQKSAARLYFETDRIGKDVLEDFSLRWRPYRTVAAWYLWRYLDPDPVCY